MMGTVTADDHVCLPVNEPTDSSRFVREAHLIVRDLLVPDAARYWTDFLLTSAIAYASFFWYLRARTFSLAQIAALAVCGLAIYRAVVFTHEIVHRREGSFRAFAVVWNVLCGVPLLLPSFMYGNHKGHHANNLYSTWADPEYLLRGSASRVRMMLFLLLPLIYPVLPAIRFLLLTPTAAIVPAVDRVLWRYGSSLYVMNEAYRREYDASATSRSRWVQEFICCGFAWTVVALTATHRVEWAVLLKTYVLFVFWMSINQVRTLAAHRYSNHSGAPVSYVEQVLDTHTFDRGRWLPHLWAPVGLRYHALHHLMPAMPYHAMSQAHNRLIAQLPPDSPYHRTRARGLWSVLTAALLNRPIDSRGPLSGVRAAQGQL